MSRKPRVQSKRPRRTKLADRDECGDNGALKMGRMLNELRAELTTANLLLAAFVLVSQATRAAYNSLGLESPPGFELLDNFGMIYALVYWLEVDNRKYNIRLPYCRGIFLYVIGFLTIPYYLFKTRGKYAFLTLFIFLCVIILASFIGMLAAGLLIGSRFD